MGHNCCSKQNVRRGLWSPEEDEKLINYITSYGHGSWSSVPKLAGLERCGKSCRLRWINYLRPDLKRGSFSAEEERIIIDIHRIIGNKWAQIAKQLPGRTDNEVKNFWNSFIKKKLISQGLDPKTHTFLSPPQNNNNREPFSFIQSMISQNYSNDHRFGLKTITFPSNIDTARHDSWGNTITIDDRDRDRDREHDRSKHDPIGFLSSNPNLSSKTGFNHGFDYGVGVREESSLGSDVVFGVDTFVLDRCFNEITGTEAAISKTNNEVQQEYSTEFVEFDQSSYGVLGFDNNYVNQFAWMHGLLM